MARETRSDARVASEGPRPTMKGGFLPPRPRQARRPIALRLGGLSYLIETGRSLLREHRLYQDREGFPTQSYEPPPQLTAICQRNLGRLSMAVLNDEALRLNPNFAEAYRNRGVTKAKLGKHEEAIAELEQAMRLKPEFKEKRRE